MPEDSAGGLGTLQTQILRYLAHHPDAKDTVEGIMNWWLPGGDKAVKASDIERALAGLAARGWVTVNPVGQGARLYGLDRARQQEIRKLLTRPISHG